MADTTYNSVLFGAFDVTIDGKYFEVADGKVVVDFAPFNTEPQGGSNHAKVTKKQQTIEVTIYKGTGFDLIKVLAGSNVTVRSRGLDTHTYELQHSRRIGDAKTDLSSAEQPLTYSAGSGNAYVDGVQVK